MQNSWMSFDADHNVTKERCKLDGNGKPESFEETSLDASITSRIFDKGAFAHQTLDICWENKESTRLGVGLSSSHETLTAAQTRKANNLLEYILHNNVVNVVNEETSERKRGCFAPFSLRQPRDYKCDRNP